MILTRFHGQSKKWDFRKEAACHNCTVCAASLKKFNKIVKTTLVRFCYGSQAKSILQSAVPLNYLLGDPFLGQAQYGSQGGVESKGRG